MSPCPRCWLECASNGDLARMQLLLAQLAASQLSPESDTVALLNCSDEHGRTALFLSCMRNDVDTARWLLEQGVDANIRDVWDQSAFLKSVINGCTECVQLLLELGVDTHLLDSDGKSALLWACEFDEVSCLRFLWPRLDLLADSAAPAQAPGGLSPLMAACRQGNIECATFLAQEARVNLEEEDECGKTALIHSAMSGNLRCMALLLSCGAAVEHADHDGDTPLIWAAWQGHAECLRFLIVDAHANINHQNEAGLTGLMNAVRWGHAPCVRLLLDHQADATLASKTDSTAWSLAVCSDSPDDAVIEWLSNAAAMQRSRAEPSASSAASSIAPSSAASSSSFSPAAPLHLSLAQTCFQDGLRSIFQWLLLRESVATLSSVCRGWRSAWAGCVQRNRPPLYFHPRNADALARALKSPLITQYLTSVSTYATEAAFDEGIGASASSAASSAATGSSSSFPKRPSAVSARSRCVLSASDLAVLAARVPHLSHLSAQIWLSPDEEIESSEDEDEEDQPLAPESDVPLVPVPFDPYGPTNLETFRFPAALQTLRVRMESSGGSHNHHPDGDDDEESNPNVPRLLLQISRLQFLHTLVVCLPSSDCEPCEDDILSLLLRPPSLRSLTLYTPREQDHIPLSSPSQLWSLPHKQSLEHLSLNRGDCSDFIVALVTATSGLLSRMRLVHLRSLDLSRTVIDERMGALWGMLPGLKTLAPARWAHSRDWALLQAMTQLRRVHLHLRQEPSPQLVPPEDIAHLAALTLLTHLSLAHMDLSANAATAEALGNAMRAAPQLKIIHMSHVKLPAHAISLLAACALALEELSFHRCPLQGGRATDAVELLRPLGFLDHLHTLRCVQSLTDATPALLDALTYPSRFLPHLHTLSWPPSMEWQHAPLPPKPAIEEW